jgi:hypothetical protein
MVLDPLKIIPEPLLKEWSRWGRPPSGAASGSCQAHDGSVEQPLNP